MGQPAWAIIGEEAEAQMMWWKNQTPGRQGHPTFGFISKPVKQMEVRPMATFHSGHVHPFGTASKPSV
ncbi:uncharacterized protein An11g03360 [Aspergillus niger]|uniref:Contig An11c0150, genomic contig n=2 Tax=Aspergillus niger TaxID=5061 RepID=A2QW04_ASPNC|nr:uncharacterized protein An11g03360 [Aspergillus niger]CAK48327.1 unnamed protein product [Aspergillus niger]